MLGSDVWLGGAEDAARQAAQELRLPVIANGQARGVLPRGHELLVTRARSVALRRADLVIVAGTPLDFRLGYGSFGPKDAPARVVHVADAPGGIATHVPLAASASGDLAAFFTALAAAGPASGADAGTGAGQADPEWVPGLAEATRAALEADGPLLASEADPVHPARIYGELLKVLDDDAVVIGDGGDFVLVRRQVHRAAPAGRMARSRTVRLPGHRTRLRHRRPDRPSGRAGRAAARRRRGRLLADGRGHAGPARAARGHGLREQRRLGPERHPMRALYGYDVAADLQPGCRYDEVVRALGGAGELVTTAAGIGPALRRAFAAGVPYLVNVVTDPEIAYPRSTTGV